MVVRPMRSEAPMACRHAVTLLLGLVPMVARTAVELSARPIKGLKLAGPVPLDPRSLL